MGSTLGERERAFLIWEKGPFFKGKGPRFPKENVPFSRTRAQLWEKKKMFLFKCPFPSK